MRATLTFKLPEEQSDFQAAVKSLDMQSAIWEISQEIFRPARKHGYSDTRISELLEKCGDSGPELIGELERRFYEILGERDLTNQA